MNFRPDNRTGYALKQLRHKSDCRWSWTNKQWLAWLRRRDRTRRNWRTWEKAMKPELINLILYGNNTMEVRPSER